MEIITGIFTILTSGAGGGIIGGLLGLFRKSQEMKERIEFERLQIEREENQRVDRDNQRNHDMEMLRMGGDIDLQQSINEWNSKIEIANQQALSKAQDGLNNLNTTSGMDNYRASIRPTLAIWVSVLFTVMLVWSFYKWNHLIDNETGYEILMGLFATLSFSFTSVIVFYYVNRNNPVPSGMTGERR